MADTYWKKQTTDKPLFPDLLWSRPENKLHAGKLLVVGGNLHAFAAPAEAYAAADKAGAGAVRVILPDATKKIVGSVLENVEYAPSTPSGSFSQKALAELLSAANWADAVLIAGDLGRNSETSILLEKFIQKYSGPLILTKDAADYAIQIPEAILDRNETLLAVSLAQLQKLAVKAGSTTAFTFEMDLLRLSGALHDLTQKHSIKIIVQHLEQLHCAANGQIVSTPYDQKIWRNKTAAQASVWWMQNRTRPVEAMSTAIIEMQKLQQ